MHDTVGDGQRVSPSLLIGFVGAFLILLAVILFTFQRYRVLIGSASPAVFSIVFMAMALTSALLLVIALKQSRISSASATVLLVAFTIAFFATLQIYPQANGSSVVGWDSFYNVRVATDIAETGKVIPSLYADHYTQDYLLKWPGFPIFSVMSSEATGVTPLQLARYLPTALNLPLIAVMWAIVGRLYRERQVLPIGVFSLVFLFQSFCFHSWMVEESLGYPLFMVSILTGIAYARTPRISWAIAFALSLVGTTMTHHLCTFMLAFLLLFFSVFTGFRSAADDGRPNALVRRRLTLMSTISFAFWIAYSSIIGVTIMRVVSMMLLSVVSPSSTIVEYRGYQSFWDLRSTVIVLMTAAVALYLVTVIVRNTRNGTSFSESWAKAIVTWGGSLFATVFVFSRVVKSPFILNYSRILAFPWIFIFQGGLERRQRSRRLWTLVIVCCVFGLFNLLSINPYIYAADYRLAEGEQYLLNSESALQIMSQVLPDGTIVCDSPTAQVVEGWMMRTISVLRSSPDSGTDLFEQGDIVVIRVENDGLRPFIALYHTNETLACVSDSGAFSVYVRNG